MTRLLNPHSKAATARASQRAKAADRAKKVGALQAGTEAIHQKAKEAFSEQERICMRLHPQVARIYAIDLAERARIYAWSERIGYTTEASRLIDKIVRECRYDGMDANGWKQLCEWVQPKIDAQRHTITARLHLACRDIIKSHFTDNIEMRAWALAAQVVLHAEQRIDDRYTQLIEQRLNVKLNVNRDEPTRCTLIECLATIAGARLEQGDLEAHINEITNFILTIKL